MKFLVYHQYYGPEVMNIRDLLGVLECNSEQEAKDWAEKNSQKHENIYGYVTGKIILEPYYLPIFHIEQSPWTQNTLDMWKKDDEEMQEYYAQQMQRDAEIASQDAWVEEQAKLYYGD